MADPICNGCGQPLGAPIYSGNEGRSITSLCQIVSARTVVYCCRNCSHIQTGAFGDLASFYNDDYLLLTESEDEDQVYRVDADRKIFRYDHQAATMLEWLDIPPGARLLDYGCAKASTLRKILEIRPDIDLHLFDISDKYREFWHGFAGTERCATYELNPAWRNRMDLVTSFFSMEHVANTRDMLSNVYDLLTDGGRFYCIVPDVTQNLADFIVIDHINHFNRESIGFLLDSCGFELISLDSRAHESALVFVARKRGAGGARSFRPDREKIVENLAFAESTARYWYDIHARIRNLEQEIAEGEEIAIYGAGFYGSFLLQNLDTPSRVRFFVDQDPFKQGKHMFDLPVIAPDELPERVNTVFVGLNPRIARQAIGMIESWRTRPVTCIYL